jgi:hypothetical protein
MKKCTKCKVNKSLTDYHKSKISKDRHVSACKVCESKRKQDLYDPIKHNETYEKGKVKYLARQKVYYAENKEVIKKTSKAYYKKNKQKWLEAGWKAKGIFNRQGKIFTKEDFDYELTRANQECEICHNDGNEHKKGLCVDHDHNTGIVRGILCGHCNVAIGMFKDDIIKLNQAIKYLKNEIN